MTATLDNPVDVPPGYLTEVLKAIQRASQAGARGALLFVGIGQYGIVLCEEHGHAWKVFRRGSSYEQAFLESMVRDEYEWLVAAARTSIRDNVPRAYRADLRRHVLERDCIEGAPGVWSDEGKLFDLHKKIERAMMKEAGWTAPEFKGNSYILSEQGPILVDISMAQRIGTTLLRHIERVLSGEIRSYERPHDLAFYVLREIQERTLQVDQAREVLRELVRLDPEIASGFTLPAGIV